MSETTVPTIKERLAELTASIEKGIRELFESDKYKQYLSTMSRFHKYSVNNTMLIYMQRSNATHVAGFNKWRDQFGRNVIKGEKGIRIIAPAPFKKKIEKEKLDPDTKLPIKDENGNTVMEEKTVQIRSKTALRPHRTMNRRFSTILPIPMPSTSSGTARIRHRFAL